MNVIPENVQATLALRYFGLFKIPLLFYIRPSVLKITDQIVVIKIPFRRRNKNHLKSMYFGSLAMGAELAAGLLGVRFIRESQHKISMVFKHFTADFLKRAEGDTIFICEDGDTIKETIRLTEETGERQEITVNVIAQVPSKLGDDPVAKFTMTVSVKRK